jgi:hypothetical protein
MVFHTQISIFVSTAVRRTWVFSALSHARNAAWVGLCWCENTRVINPHYRAQLSFSPQFLHVVCLRLLNIASAEEPIGGDTGVAHRIQHTVLARQLQNRILAKNNTKKAS